LLFYRVDLAARCRREGVKDGGRDDLDGGVGTTPKTASKAAVFCRLPTDTPLLVDKCCPRPFDMWYVRREAQPRIYTLGVSFPHEIAFGWEMHASRPMAAVAEHKSRLS